MASSPYTPSDLKQYMRKHNLEELINTTVNDLLREKPEDPYGFMIGMLQKKASSDIQILDIFGIDTITSQGFPAIKVHAKVLYMNQPLQFLIQQPFGILSDDNMLFDGDDQKFGGKGMDKGITYLNESISKKLVGYKCTDQSDVDKMLESAFKQNNLSGLYQINISSFILPRIQSQVLAKPLYEIIRQRIEQPKIGKIQNVPFFVNCLHGGKAIGSKCKVFKYMIINKNAQDPFIAAAILQAIRKAIVSGKGGEAALKFSPDGSFVCPVDTIMDNLKIVEEAINNTAGAKQNFVIGLSWAADTLFSQDTKKYELENPKTPFDNDQMIDYLVKLVTDKPLIKYLEDPLASSQRSSYVKLKEKLQESEQTKDVKIGSRINNIIKLPEYNISQEIKPQVQDLSQLCNIDSHPDLTPEELQEKNKEKFTLDYIQLRMFELRTLTEVLNLSTFLAKYKTKLVLQDNLYETSDSSLIDIALGIDALACLSTINGNKLDRLSKLNRIKEIIAISAKNQNQCP